MAGSGSGSALVASLMSAAQDVEILERKNLGLKMELEQMKNENELVQGKFEIEVSERIKLQKEFEEFKVLNSRLTKERDELSNRFAVYEQYHEKRICDIEKLNSRLIVERDGLCNRLKEEEDYYKKEIIELERKICQGEKLKELNSRLREERDGLCNRLKEKDDDQLEIIKVKRQICELECNRFKAKTNADVYEKRIKELEGRLLIMNVEKDAYLLLKLI